MRCPMCRAEIDAAALQGICAACPLYAVTKGCRLELIPCPGCGYHSLASEHDEQEADDVFAGHSPESLPLPTVEECNGALRLSEVPSGTAARLVGFNGLGEKDLGRLTAHGLLPGVRVEVIQRVPAVILGVYQTELALESSLAAGVWVVPEQQAATRLS